ncbi:uncharacterized protein EV420DRAFT_1649205 [Desarmillaria tabescens]|uniref:Uncharacterized protein n=1 Tax=Armillaria tabescens TaxID=1929756 RepID=A0AA39MQJ9_ARMTA|nr:uncharacterized protein EV420DRAFT_1649205 [Desarmillaria tabescens]KAK0443416.1 hypothetical protein EV420DRAFT_1649205 [Desarmillaria tabescens]
MVLNSERIALASLVQAWISFYSLILMTLHGLFAHNNFIPREFPVVFDVLSPSRFLGIKGELYSPLNPISPSHPTPTPTPSLLSSSFFYHPPCHLAVRDIGGASRSPAHLLIRDSVTFATLPAFPCTVMFEFELEGWYPLHPHSYRLNDQVSLCLTHLSFLRLEKATNETIRPFIWYENLYGTYKEGEQTTDVLVESFYVSDSRKQPSLKMLQVDVQAAERSPK